MDLGDLLAGHGLDLSNVLVLRHRPPERELAKRIGSLASERPDVFNAYQSTQNPRVEGMMSRASHIASFVARGPAKALFVGVYKQQGSQCTTGAAFLARPEVQPLRRLGWQADDEGRFLHFDLRLTDVLKHWSGRLVIRWPPPEISWARWASGSKFIVEAITEESCLTQPMPTWDRLVLTYDDLQNLERSWQERLAGWGGVYLIFDRSIGKGYVGSAGGVESLWQRWRAHVAVGGDAEGLRDLDPSNFVFTILERSDLRGRELVALENSWKARLHTVEHGLNRG